MVIEVEAIGEDLKRISRLIDGIKFKSRQLRDVVLNQVICLKVNHDPFEGVVVSPGSIDMVGAVLSHLEAAKAKNEELVKMLNKVNRELKYQKRWQPRPNASLEEIEVGKLYNLQIQWCKNRFNDQVLRHRIAVKVFKRLGKNIVRWIGLSLRLASMMQNEEAPSTESNQKLAKKLKKDEDDTGQDQEQECAICLDNIQSGAVKQQCDHAFHKSCINRWLDTCITCPICRCLLPHPSYQNSTFNLATLATS